MKNSRSREWGWILFGITFFAMSTAHTAAATEVEIRANNNVNVKVVSGFVEPSDFDKFLRKATQQQNTLPKIDPDPLDRIKNFAINTDFLREVLDAIKAALLSASVPESPMLSPVP